MTYPSIAAIQAVVCAHFRVTHLDLLSRRRGRAISRPRQVGMWLARHTTPLSLPEIGREFQRDHTTVMHAVARVGDLMNRDAAFAEDVELLRRLLES